MTSTVTTSNEYFVVSGNQPVYGYDFDHVTEILAGSAAQTKIFESHAKAADWANSYIAAHSLPMVMPVSELDSYFNGGEKKNQAEYAFWSGRDSILRAFKKEGIDLETVEFRPWIEKFEIYNYMQQQNLSRGDRLHDAIVYCAVQAFVNGRLRFDIVQVRSWREVFIACNDLNEWLETLKAKAH